MRKSRFAIWFAVVLAMALLGAPQVLAHVGSASAGAGSETTTNSLSEPAIFVPDASTFAGLHCPAGPAEAAGTPTNGYYAEGQATWQAECRTSASRAGVSAAWGDNLGSARSQAGTPVRVEVALTTALTSPMIGYQVVSLPPNAQRGEATYGTTGAPQQYTTVGVWAEGAALKIVNSDGNVVYSGPASAEINAIGQVVYRYDWGGGNGQSAVGAAGDYEVTISSPLITFRDGSHSASLSLTVAPGDSGPGGGNVPGAGEGSGGDQSTDPGTLPGMCNGRTDASTTLVAHAAGSASGVSKLVLNVSTNAAGEITGQLLMDRGSMSMLVTDWCRLWEHLPDTAPKGECEDGYPDGANTGHLVGLTTIDGQDTVVRVDVRELADGTALYRVRYKAWTGEDSESESGDDCSGWTWVPGSPTDEAWGPLDQLTIEPMAMGGGGEGPTITTATIPPGHVAIGTTVYDTATLSGPSSNPPGAVTYKLYSDSACADPVADLTPENNSVIHAVVPDSAPYTFTSAGSYYLRAEYDGQGNNAHAISDCTSEVVVVDPNHPTITTATMPSGPVAIGTSVFDTAALTGATGTAGGTITYHVYTDSVCSALLADLTPSSNAVVNGMVPNSKSLAFNNAGTYYFQAIYNGDHNNAGPVSSPCTGEVVAVDLNSPTITAQLSVPGPIVTGTHIYAAAALTGATDGAGGTVRYTVYSDSACSARVADVTPSGNSVVNGVVPNSKSIAFTRAGTYYFQATYTGDHNNFGPVSSPCAAGAVTVIAPAARVLGASTGIPGTGAGIGLGSAILLLGASMIGFGLVWRRRGAGIVH